MIRLSSFFTCLFLLGHALTACTQGAADLDAAIVPDGFSLPDGVLTQGCTGTDNCTDGLSCCPVGDESFCVSTERDRNNCGACGAKCDAAGSDRCEGGDCVCGGDPECPAGIECCGDDGCATTDDSCGSCGTVCNQGMTCTGGACLCQGQDCGPNAMCCGDGCADLAEDNNNCGQCGNKCGDGEQCRDGECICTGAGYACSPGYSCCDQGCRNLSNNYDNCGSCLFRCNDNNVCDNGVCEGMQLAEPAAQPTAATAIYAGGYHGCAILDNQTVRCWGDSVSGRLGLGHLDTIGDDERPHTASEVRIGEPIVDMALGNRHSCSRTLSGNILCWGSAISGALGYGNTISIGDNETPQTAGYVALGTATTTSMSAGFQHTCAAFTDGSVRCWGLGTRGRLGYGNTNNIGDDELIADMNPVDVGFAVASVAVGEHHSCALSASGAVRCWGDNNFGQLGYGHTRVIGDNETPASAGNVDIGGTVVQLSAGFSHTCAVLSNGKVRCWGRGGVGQLGYGNTRDIGDDETPASAGDVNIGGIAIQVATGLRHTCALLADGNIRCWGDNNFGQLGYGHTETIGDNEAPATAGNVAIGGIATAITSSLDTPCALLSSGDVTCWGQGLFGQHGQGFTDNIGDDDTPANYPPIQLF